MPMNSQQNGSAFARRILFIVLLVAALALATVYGREGQEGPIHSVQNAVIGVTGQVAAVSAGLGGATAAAGNHPHIVRLPVERMDHESSPIGARHSEAVRMLDLADKLSGKSEKRQTKPHGIARHVGRDDLHEPIGAGRYARHFRGLFGHTPHILRNFILCTRDTGGKAQKRHSRAPEDARQKPHVLSCRSHE